MSKVLVIDDDESILDAITLVLEDAGYDVQGTFKGKDAFRKVAEFHPDVILLDLLMSGHDGRHICKKLKRNPVTKSIPIIMISAHPTAERGAVECGADDFLAKPFDTDILLGKIKKHLH